MNTNFTWLDGGIVGVYLLATMIAGIMVRKYVGKVEHFLLAGREMNLYLGIASLAATEFGIVTCMYTAQNGYQMGFAGATPGILMAISMWVVGRTGFCVKPLRDAGVMTIPELFQNRFGPRIRWLAGVVIVLGGLLNMGVFLRVGGDFLVQVCGFDASYLVITMATLLAAVAIYTILGGMLSVLVTDFLQFVVMSAGLILVTLLILYKIGWTNLTGTVFSHYGAGGFNPFLHPKVGWSYVVFNAFQNFAVVLTWQTVIQRLLAAKDTATGRKIYTRTSFFFVCRFMIPGVWGIAALYTIAPDQLRSLFSEAERVTMSAAEIFDRGSMLAMPHFLGTAVPMGLMGILVAAMLAADMSTDSSYMLTWGSVIYNDIMAPFHKGRWSDKKAILISRCIVACIGIFLLFFGLLYQVKGDMWTYLTLTSTIYLASMSVLLIACCYWKRANNWGAGAAIIVGAAVPIGFLVMQEASNFGAWLKCSDVMMQKLSAVRDLAETVGPQHSGIAAFVLTAVAMVVGSLLKPHSSAPAGQIIGGKQS